MSGKVKLYILVTMFYFLWVKAQDGQETTTNSSTAEQLSSTTPTSAQASASIPVYLPPPPLFEFYPIVEEWPEFPPEIIIPPDPIFCDDPDEEIIIAPEFVPLPYKR